MDELSKRVEYGSLSLARADLQLDPIEQLKNWWSDARKAQIPDLDAITLSTVDTNNRPDARMVLLKYISHEGLEFFTNYKSAKARQLENNPYAAMTLYWSKLERQVRIRGLVSKSSRARSQDYFMKRPRGAQISAWVSQQSSVVSSREELDKGFEEIESRFLNQEIICPEHWGGYTLFPDYFEFWQGRSNRLHDRFSYQRDNDNQWNIERLAP
jgi:pyridoxamine 5'-phosphate oxidase